MDETSPSKKDVSKGGDERGQKGRLCRHFPSILVIKNPESEEGRGERVWGGTSSQREKTR